MIKTILLILLCIFLSSASCTADLPTNLRFLNDYEIFIHWHWPRRVNLENNQTETIKIKLFDGTILSDICVDSFKMLGDGFVFVTEDLSYEPEYKKYDGYWYLDNTGKYREFIHDFRPVGVTGWDTRFTYSYDGKKILIDAFPEKGELISNLYVVTLKTNEVRMICRDPGWAYARSFLRDNRTVVYQNRKNEIWKWDYETQKSELLATLNVKIHFGDVSYDDSQILCTNEFNIYIFDLKTNELKLVKHYPRVDWTVAQFGVPLIVSNEAAWVEGHHGFLFGKVTPGFMKCLDTFFNQNIANPDLYYYDLDTNEEYLLMPDAHVYQLNCRKKVK